MNNAYNIEDDFLPLYTSKKRYFFISGGRGSLKSHSLHDFILRLTYKKDEGILFTRYTMTSAKKSIIPEFKKAMDRLGLTDDFDVTESHVINKRSKSFIWFTGIKTSSSSQTGNLKSLSSVTNWVVEEAEDFNDESEFNRINKSIRSKHTQNRVILVMNPTTKEHFLYKKWFEDNKGYKKIDGYNVLVSSYPRLEHIHTTYLIGTDYLDKEWLLEAYQARTRAKKGYDPITKKTLTETQKEDAENFYINEYLGGWKERADGAIFSNWETGDFDESLPFIFGADWGFANDPSTIVKVAINEKRKLLYVQEVLYAKGLGTNELTEAFKAHCGKSMVVADNSELRLINEIRRENINIYPVVKKPNSILAGINKMKNYNIVVCGESPNLIKEFNNYCWIDKGSKEVPIDDHNHLIDPIRYALTRLKP